MIPSAVATKLAKILPRLASEHDGEVINTVRALDRTLTGAGLDWHALSKIIAAGGMPEVTFRGFEAEPFDWSGFKDFAADWKDPASKADLDAPEAPSRRWGLPIWGVKKIEPWTVVAGHCLQLDWTIPKACGGKALTKADKDRLRAVEGYAPVTNAEANWIEGVVAKVHAAREAWRSRDVRAAA